MSSEYLGREHAVFFRHLCNGVEEATVREKHIELADGSEAGKKRWAEWHANIEPALRGAALVTFIANVEHLVGKKPNNSWDIPDSWYGKEELKYFRVIRHCWAHAAGRILSNRKTELEQYLERLKNSKFSDRERKVIQPYFYFENDKVILERSGLERARLLCTELLAEKGLVIRWWASGAENT